MVASQDGDSLSVLYLENKDVEESFYAVEPSIDIIAHEQIICILLLISELLATSRRSRKFKASRRTARGCLRIQSQALALEPDLAIASRSLLPQILHTLTFSQIDFTSFSLICYLDSSEERYLSKLIAPKASITQSK